MCVCVCMSIFIYIYIYIFWQTLVYTSTHTFLHADYISIRTTHEQVQFVSCFCWVSWVHISLYMYCVVCCICSEIKKLWRTVTVEGVDERKIEEYLQKQGITSMQDIEVKRVNIMIYHNCIVRSSSNCDLHFPFKTYVFYISFM